MGLFGDFGDKLKKAATERLGEDAVAKAAELARQAQEKAKEVAALAGKDARQLADMAAAEARRRHDDWQAARDEDRKAERILAADAGVKAPLTYELKEMLGLPMSKREEARKKTDVEDGPPGAWFAPFGLEMMVPVWLSPSHPFFTGKMKLTIREIGVTGNGGVCTGLFEPQPVYTLNAVTWLYETLIIQCVYEQWRRGIAIMDASGHFVMPSFTDEGFPIIEQDEQDDGSVVALVASLDTAYLEIEDQKNFTKTLGRYRVTSWKAKSKLVLSSPIGAYTKPPPVIHSYAFGRPRVEQRVVRKADPDRNPYAPPNTTHGSAQFAWVDELADRKVIVAEAPDRAGGHTFLGLAVYREPNRIRLAHYAAFGGDGHRLIVGPPGSGKFTSAIAQLLLSSGDGDSAFVFDVKNGEAAKITSEHRASLGPVTVLDPFGITGIESGGINPIDLLREDGPELVSRAERLTDAIFVTSSPKDPFWEQAAKKLLASLLMHIGTCPLIPDEERNLKTLRNIVRDYVPAEVLAAMKRNPAGDGEIAAEARAILAGEESGAEKQLYSIVQTLNVNIGFLKMPQILKVTERTTFDPRQLKERVSTLYIVTPDHELANVNRWVRLIYTYVMEQLREAPGACDVHVVLDEFPALGKFDRVAQDMAQTRSLGVHMHVVVQTFQQLNDTYGSGWERFQGTSAVTHILGVRDKFTADHFSKMMGQTTIRTTNRGVNRSNNGGGGVNEGESFTGRPLITPDELLTMPYKQCLALIGGMNPIKLEKVAYFDPPPM